VYNVTLNLRVNEKTERMHSADDREAAGTDPQSFDTDTSELAARETASAVTCTLRLTVVQRCTHGDV
jgi:hypothetical protein